VQTVGCSLNKPASHSVCGSNTAYDQDTSVQEQPLLELLRHRGWPLHRIYAGSISGSKERRCGLDQLMAEARRGKSDIVVAWRFDRLARSVKQLVLALEEFHSLGVDFISHQQVLDIGSLMGKAMFTIIAAMAELERSVLREWMRSGLDHAREHSTKSRRPAGQPRVVFDRAKERELRRAGWSWGRIARKLGASVQSNPSRGRANL